MFFLLYLIIKYGVPHGLILGPLSFSLSTHVSCDLIHSLSFENHPYTYDPQSCTFRVNLSCQLCRVRDLLDASPWSITGTPAWTYPQLSFHYLLPVSKCSHRAWSLMPFSSPLLPYPVWFISKPCHLSLQSGHVKSNHCPPCLLWSLQARAPTSLNRRCTSLVCLPHLTLVSPLFIPHSSQDGLFTF